MNANNKELRDILAQLNLSEDQKRALMEDVQAGDDLMRRLDRIQVADELLDRIEARVRREPGGSELLGSEYYRTSNNELHDLLVQLSFKEGQAQDIIREILN